MTHQVPKSAIKLALNAKAKHREWVTRGHTVVLPKSSTTWGQLEIVAGPTLAFTKDPYLNNNVIRLHKSGSDGRWACEVTFRELDSAASVFATAVGNKATVQEIQLLADTLGQEGDLATDPKILPAIKTFIHYLRTRRINTANYLTLWDPARRSPDEIYDFDFEVLCLKLALHYQAVGFARAIVLEIRRESYFKDLTVVQFQRAFEVDSYLDGFLIEWATSIESGKHWNGKSKLRCLEEALPKVPALRTLFSDHIENKPAFEAQNVSVARLVHENNERAKKVAAFLRKRKKEAKEARAQLKKAKRTNMALKRAKARGRAPALRRLKRRERSAGRSRRW